MLILTNNANIEIFEYTYNYDACINRFMGSEGLILTERIAERLQYENPWWVNK